MQSFHIHRHACSQAVGSEMCVRRLTRIMRHNMKCNVSQTRLAPPNLQRHSPCPEQHMIPRGTPHALYMRPHSSDRADKKPRALYKKMLIYIRSIVCGQTRLAPPNLQRHSPCLEQHMIQTGTPHALNIRPHSSDRADKKTRALYKKMLIYMRSIVGDRLYDRSPHISHISSSTSRTMLLTLIQSWSSGLSFAKEECQLLLARTSLVLHTNTS